MNSILAAFGLDPAAYDARPYGSGHINRTYRVARRDVAPRAGGSGSDVFVLQQINTAVFKHPEVIARNIQATGDHLARVAPEYLFLRALPTVDGAQMYQTEADGCWRMLPFVADSVSLEKADTPAQAYQAARQFGRFARLTGDMNLDAIRPSIPDFHNLALRQQQFERAIDGARAERKAAAAGLIAKFNSRADIVALYARAKRELPDRLMHHDTKIGNVLLNAKTFEGVCVCDLDTLMTGKVISDLGDMVRTYVCPVPEDDPDTAKVVVRADFYAALIEGYLSEMGERLTDAERKSLFFAGEFMIYMQGIRFLADFLNDDVYYPVKHPEHNFERARNQWALLQRLSDMRPQLERVIDSALASQPAPAAIK